MKKTVFLFILMCFLSWNTQVSGNDTELYAFDGYQIRCSSYSNRDGRGYQITKLGDNPFEYDLFFDEYEIYISDVTEINNKHVLYGYTHYFNGDTYYDPFVIVLDEDGNQEFLFREDLGLLEEVRHVVEIDNVLLIHVEQSIMEYSYEFYENYFITFDFEYNELYMNNLKEEIKRVQVTDKLFLYDYDYSGDFDGAVTSDCMYLLDDTLDIEANKVFTESVEILFINEAILNDSIVHNGVYIDYPGDYNLEYNDFTYTFTVLPVITGVENNETYTESVIPYFEKGNAYLNDDLFLSGTEITEPGNYVLTIYGANGFTQDIRFTINAKVDGVLNDQTYDDDVTITFEGEGYLNNTYVESPYTIDDEGDYILKVTGEGDYIDTYNFQIDKEPVKSGVIDFVQKFDIVFLGIVVIAGGIYLKKK